MKKAWFHMMVVAAHGPCHGAEIRRQVDDDTGGEVQLYPVTLYRALDELTALGWLEEAPDPEAGRHNEKRRCYAITPAGRAALAAEADALAAAAHRAQAVLREGASS